MGDVGLFGGTFDPPHLGHLRALRAAMAALALRRVLVVVAADPRHREAPVATALERLEMAHAAFDEEPGVVVSDLELRRAGPTYTIDTVLALRDEGVVEPVLIVGADAAATLPTWHRADELARLVRVAVVPRPGGPHGPPEGFDAVEVEMAPVDLSSTGVRAALAAGEDPATLVPPRVVHLAAANPRYHP